MDLQQIDKHINEILNGNRDLPKFNQPEHAGVCSAGPLLIGALTVCNYTRESLRASGNAGGSETAPANWQIDELTKQREQKECLHLLCRVVMEEDEVNARTPTATVGRIKECLDSKCRTVGTVPNVPISNNYNN